MPHPRNLKLIIHLVAGKLDLRLHARTILPTLNSEEPTKIRHPNERPEVGEAELIGLLSRAACPVLHIACDVLDSALRLVRLAFGLQLLAVGHLADGFLPR